MTLVLQLECPVVQMERVLGGFSQKWLPIFFPLNLQSLWKLDDGV